MEGQPQGKGNHKGRATTRDCPYGMKYNPDIHHRRSIRITAYDYSQSGSYYITICLQDYLCLFGEIKNGAMILNDAGKMVQSQYLLLPQRFENIALDEYIIMPNHFHGIIALTAAAVGAPLVGALNNQTTQPATGQPREIAPTVCRCGRSQNTVGDIIGAFKSIVTNEYIKGVKTKKWRRFNKKLWQRNYYEHIIRNEKSYRQISEYIQTNPFKWRDDKYYG